MIGRTIGHYRILERLGSGGWGVVYRARDTELDREVALKFLQSDTAASPEDRRRFLHEAKAASALDHPNICAVYEIGRTPEGELFLVMPCYEGETLKQRLARGALPAEVAVRLAIQAADGLSKAHEKGIVHRDIKPANLLVTRDGMVKILDFGLAKLAGGSVLTQTGVTMGTPAYMSPEQVRGESVDHRTDIWSLGAVLYELVTGLSPFAGESPPAVIYAILHHEPESPSLLQPEVSAGLERIIRRALAKNPADRYQRAADLAADLRFLPTGTKRPPTEASQSSPEIAQAALPNQVTEPAATGRRTPPTFPGLPQSTSPPSFEPVPPVSTHDLPGQRSPRPPWWVVAIAAAFVLSTLFYLGYIFFGLDWPGWERYELKSDGVLLQELRPSSAAERAGLQPGDHLVAIDGRPVTRHRWQDFTRRAIPGRAYQLQIERPGTVKPLTLTFRFQYRRWDYWSTRDGFFDSGVIVTALMSLGLALFIVFRRPADPLARLGALWLASYCPGLLYFVLGLPPGLNALLAQWPLPLAGLILAVPVVAGGIGPELTCAFLASFPKRLFEPRWAWWLLWAPVMVRLPAIGLLYWHNFWGTPLPDIDRLYQIMVAARLVYWMGGLGLAMLNYRTLRDIHQRRRFRLFLLGLATASISWALIFALRVYGARLGAIADFFWSSPLPLLLVLLAAGGFGCMGAAIIRHRLFGFGVMVRRTLQYAAARRLLLAVPLLCVLVFALDLLFHADEPLGVILASRGWFYLVLGAAGGLFHWKRASWLDALDRRFFRERYDAQRILAGIVQEIRDAGAIEQVAPRVVARIEAALHPELTALLVLSPGEEVFQVLASAGQTGVVPALPSGSKLVAILRLLKKPVEISRTETDWLRRQLPPEETDFIRQAGLEWLFPITLDPAGPDSLLALGPKRSEEPYSMEDQDLLAAIAAALAMLAKRPGAGRMPVVLEERPLLANRYRLDRVLGQGGMGTVYRAHDTQLDRVVAVKRMRHELLALPEARGRFKREARAAAAFTHPNVVTIHDFGLTDDQGAFLVMELLDGVSLRQELQRLGQVPPKRAGEIFAGICAAVAAAHERRLLHRDLKPENIFLSRAGGIETPKVLDFGLAKTVSGDEETATAGVDTAPGMLLGTLRYMSPEQLQGGSPAESWDLWALAVIAFEMLAGGVPFRGETRAEYIQAVLDGRLTLLSEHLGVPATNWDRFFKLALATDQKRRPATAERLLSQFLESGA